MTVLTRDWLAERRAAHGLTVAYTASAGHGLDAFTAYRAPALMGTGGEPLDTGNAVDTVTPYLRIRAARNAARRNALPALYDIVLRGQDEMLTRVTYGNTPEGTAARRAYALDARLIAVEACGDWVIDRTDADAERWIENGFSVVSRDSDFGGRDETSDAAAVWLAENGRLTADIPGLIGA